MTNYENPTFLKAICIKDNEEGELLGNAGMNIIKNMKENYSDRYWRLAFSGELTQKVKQREQELMELRLHLMDEFEQREPRPRTNSFLAVANHMNHLAEQVDKIIDVELKKPI